MSFGMAIALRTFSFSARTSSGSKLVGSSIATRASSWSR
jgi:hypothetical protein